MVKKYLLTIIVSLLVGFLLSSFMLKQYDINTNIIPSYKGSETVYLVQQGVYSSQESMQNNTKNIPYYIYTLDNNLYYVYIGMSLKPDNITKIQNYYKDLNIETIVKSITLTDSEFLSTLKQCDELLEKTDDKDTIKEVIKQVLSKYENK